MQPRLDPLGLTDNKINLRFKAITLRVWGLRMNNNNNIQKTKPTMNNKIKQKL